LARSSATRSTAGEESASDRAIWPLPVAAYWFPTGKGLSRWPPTPTPVAQDHQPDLVDQARGQQRLGEAGASADLEVPSLLLLEFRDLGCDIAGEDRDRCPGALPQGTGGDVLDRVGAIFEQPQA
jgi:hypothetical protein